MKSLFYILLAIFSFSCSGIGSNDVPDGTYNATVEYYNPRTGTRSFYTLPVDVRADSLRVIHWPNGGWLDESHFKAPEISGGVASFKSDKGYEYTVSIENKK